VFEPANLGSRGEHVTLRSPRRLNSRLVGISPQWAIAPLNEVLDIISSKYKMQESMFCYRDLKRTHSISPTQDGMLRERPPRGRKLHIPPKKNDRLNLKERYLEDYDIFSSSEIASGQQRARASKWNIEMTLSEILIFIRQNKSDHLIPSRASSCQNANPSVFVKFLTVVIARNL
jgi:hypothetical protein